jgi:hypothetical protein
MANLLVREDEKEKTPRLEKVFLIKELQIQSPVKGIQTLSTPEINGCLVAHEPNPGYKM